MFSAVVRDFASFLILLGVERVCCVRALRAFVARCVLRVACCVLRVACCVMRVACCVMRRSTPLKSIFYVRRARNCARSKGGGRGAFFIDLFFCYSLLSAVQKSPPPFSFCENCRFSKHRLVQRYHVGLPLYVDFGSS